MSKNKTIKKQQVTNPTTKDHDKPESKKTVMVSPDQALLDAKIAEQAAMSDEEIFGVIREDELNDFSLAHEPTDLKANFPEIYELSEKKIAVFRFCDCTENPHRIDELTTNLRPPLKWAIVNRERFPQFRKYFTGNSGGIIRSGQILLWKPWEHHQIIKRKKAEFNAQKDAAGQGVNIASRNAEPGMAEIITDQRQASIGESDIVRYDEGTGFEDFGGAVVE
jgi:hypothetical protein